MRTNLLSELIESHGLALIVLALANIPVASRARNLYAEQSEYTETSPAVLLSTRASVVRQVQRALRQRGYYAGTIDGFMGEGTQIAIQKFDVDHCYPARPLVTRRLLVSLGIGLDLQELSR
jgi:peptidoglycan hydrolase-like protein with peptidoglycan-binding domain